MHFMNIKQILLRYISIFLLSQSIYPTFLAEQLQKKGYLEICNNHGTKTFDLLYLYFDELIDFLQANPKWSEKLYLAKERFIRSKEKAYYSTDFFGFYDESANQTRSQISFYYSIFFHEFIKTRYPEFQKAPKLLQFLEACLQLQKSCAQIFSNVAADLGAEAIFSSGQPPILFKVVKYLPSYKATKPHYDGTAFSMVVDSTNNQSLLVSPYKDSLTIQDFSAPIRRYCRSENQNSSLLIPGTLLSEFSIYPTPHIVISDGNTRYATIACAMRPHYIHPKKTFSPLPIFNY